MTTISVFEKNMEILGKRYPGLAERVSRIKINPSYKLIQTSNGNPNVLIKKGSDFVVLYDNDDPITYCDNYLEKLDLKYAPVVVFMGLGLGYHLDRYFKILGEKVGTRQIVVFEKDIELFRLALSVGDFTKIIAHPDIHFFVGESPAEIYVRLKTGILSKRDTVIALKSLKVIPLPANILLDGEYYQEILETLKNAVRQIMVLTGNDSLDSFVGLENVFYNIKHIYSNPGINTLYGKFTGRPGVVVAAGPSLNKNMHLLEGLREKALIISCDASFIPLMKNGIRPHLVTSLERTPGVDLFYSGIDNFNGVYFVALPILMPEAIDAFKGRKFIGYRSYSHFNWLEEEKGTLNVGISVANLSFKILMELGCDPIILIGQDLAYADDGDTHVKGDIFGSKNEWYSKQPAIMLEGNDGSPVKSERSWVIMKNTYEEDIASYNGTCVNATEGGAKILGAVVMPFQDAIEQYCKDAFKPNLILDEAYAGFSENVDLPKEIRRITKKSEESCKILGDFIVEFQEALEMSRQVENEIIQPFIEKDSEDIDMMRLTAIEKKYLDLSDNLGKDRILQDLMSHTLYAYDVCFSNELGFLRDVYSDRECLAIARVKKIKNWFSVVGMLLTLTRDLLEKTEQRLEEESAHAV